MTYTTHMVQHVVLAQLVPIPLAFVAARGHDRAPRPALAWLVGVVVMIATSVPAAYELAQTSALLDWTIRVALVASGTLFWMPVIGGMRARLGAAPTLAYLVTACFATTLTGVYIAFNAPTADQQIAGLIMWVPCCVIFLSAGLTVLTRAMSATQETLS